MVNLLLIELTLAFVVFCADSVDRETPRTDLQRLGRAVCGPVPLERWFTRRNTVALGRFGAVVWFLVTSGWLVSFEFDRIRPTPLFLVVAETTMAFDVRRLALGTSVWGAKFAGSATPTFSTPTPPTPATGTG